MAFGRMGARGGFGSLGGLRGALAPPSGFVFLVDSDGYYLTDRDGYYLLDKA